VIITPGIAAASAAEGATTDYLSDCLNDLYEGRDGLIDDEDHASNEEDLLSGCGSVAGLYPPRGMLTENVLITAYFDEENWWNENLNFTTIMYESEY
jgi:hypothetical protein